MKSMILEGIVTTTNDDGSTNIAPMGPIVDNAVERLVLRPFKTSTTYANLVRTGEGVFHVTDDVDLIAQASIGTISPPPKLLVCEETNGKILAGACRWVAFQVESTDATADRAEMRANVVASGRLRDFFGFNRAKHAVLEAAILATRVGFLPVAVIHEEYTRLAEIVKKTGGKQERKAFRRLERYIFE